MPSTHLALVDGRTFLEAGADIPSRLSGLLSPQEQQRLQAFLRPQRAREFLLGRLLVRHMLATLPPFHGVPVSIEERPDQGPSILLPHGHNIQAPHFSLSHRHGWIACALSLRGQVGLDVEWADPQRDLMALSTAAFAGADLVWLQQQPSGAGFSQAFYRLWCAQEAAFKYLRNSGHLVVPPPLVVDGAMTADIGHGGYLHHGQANGLQLCLCSTDSTDAVAPISLDWQQLTGTSAM